MKLPVHCQALHENHLFFKVFEITGMDDFFILLSSKNRNQRFSTSDNIIKTRTGGSLQIQITANIGLVLREPPRAFTGCWISNYSHITDVQIMSSWMIHRWFLALSLYGNLITTQSRSIIFSYGWMKCTHIHKTYILDKNVNMDQNSVLNSRQCSWHLSHGWNYTWMRVFFHYVNVHESFCSWAAEEHKALAEVVSV